MGGGGARRARPPLDPPMLIKDFAKISPRLHVGQRGVPPVGILNF